MYINDFKLTIFNRFPLLFGMFCIAVLNQYYKLSALSI